MELVIFVALLPHTARFYSLGVMKFSWMQGPIGVGSILLSCICVKEDFVIESRPDLVCVSHGRWQSAALSPIFNSGILGLACSCLSQC